MALNNGNTDNRSNKDRAATEHEENRSAAQNAPHQAPSADETGHWRLGPYGHLRSGAEPDSLEERKLKRRRITMAIGIASLLVAFVLIMVVLTVASSDSATETQAGTATEQTTEDQSGNAGGSSGDEGTQSDSGTSADSSDGSASSDDASEGSGNEVKTNQLPDSSFLYDTDIAELSKADTFNDGQRVQVEGEVVGEAIADETDSSYKWITLQDDDAVNPTTIEVRVASSLLSAIDSYGRYGQQGSIVQIQGTYQLACADHQGLSDIHADELQVLQEGQQEQDEINSVVLSSAVIAIGIGVALVIWYYLRREQMR